MTRPPGEKCAAKAFHGRAVSVSVSVSVVGRSELRPASPVRKVGVSTSEERVSEHNQKVALRNDKAPGSRRGAAKDHALSSYP